ncbi:hypothetical protein PpBr36_04674 [Pyricularia pennisetigena]|uniref:hypothetical protein n=1 Tax=Pyricularia pennisetigena TaxID=1578925 RepID=UPI0011507427|nr:hypothetical protein PpBr36_04674 [Pyricularia pennisetigena]TLS26957.1 hypothetical protein PpBr36_04674 [Pyricularia pennisetigena]
MPMFQYHAGAEEGRPPSPDEQEMALPQPIRISVAQQLARKLSEESIRTELCEGPVDSPPAAHSPQPPDQAATTSDRAELIERLKRGESPTWVPNRRLDSLFQQDGPLSPSDGRPGPRSQPDSHATLLPSAPITSEQYSPPNSATDAAKEWQRDGLNMERPRSALHSGDFTQDNGRLAGSPLPTKGLFRERQQTIWEGRWIGESISQPLRLATSPPRRSGAIDIGTRTPLSKPSDTYSPTREPSASRGSGISSLSSSFSSSFAYRHPTSPLVQSESNEDLDLGLPLSNIDLGPSRTPRRHTLSARDHSSPSVPPYHSNSRRETIPPYQAHQPRRSLVSTPSWHAITSAEASPGSPTSILRSRQQSFGSDTSPLHHASMVGSYEESILRGRMSTTPSKPLDFVAQIGVLGIGECKSSLRCPPHVTLPFSAVFYSYSSTSHGRSATEDGPSPYVGMIDLENGLKDQSGDDRAKRKAQSRNLARRARQEAAEDVSMVGNSPEEMTQDSPSNRPGTDSRKSAKSKRQPSSPRAPPGGSYRIPPKGQLQIVIKNQNKTAVKLFLVPYDLSGMEPGTKTFIRQRVFSKATTSEVSNGGSSTAQGVQQPLAETRPILRYLIHLHICCPSKGRYYLYKSVRVVFANRVPDGKEKLQNEITLPEPRFSAYKSVRVMQPTLQNNPASMNTSGPGALLAAEKAFRRRSAGYMFGGGGGHVQPGGSRFDSFLDGISPAFGAVGPAALPGGMVATQNKPVEPSASPAPRTRLESVNSVCADPTSDGCTASSSSQASTLSPPGTLRNASLGRQDRMVPEIVSLTPTRYNKLNKGDVGYGGNAFLMQASDGQSTARGAAEGLLSQRLRSLGVQEDENATAGGQLGHL